MPKYKFKNPFSKSINGIKKLVTTSSDKNGLSKNTQEANKLANGASKEKKVSKETLKQVQETQKQAKKELKQKEKQENSAHNEAKKQADKKRKEEIANLKVKMKKALTKKDHNTYIISFLEIALNLKDEILPIAERLIQDINTKNIEKITNNESSKFSAFKAKVGLAATAFKSVLSSKKIISLIETALEVHSLKDDFDNISNILKQEGTVESLITDPKIYELLSSNRQALKSIISTLPEDKIEALLKPLGINKRQVISVIDLLCDTSHLISKAFANPLINKFIDEQRPFIHKTLRNMINDPKSLAKDIILSDIKGLNNYIDLMSNVIEALSDLKIPNEVIKLFNLQAIEKPSSNISAEKRELLFSILTSGTSLLNSNGIKDNILSILTRGNIAEVIERYFPFTKGNAKTLCNLVGAFFKDEKGQASLIKIINEELLSSKGKKLSKDSVDKIFSALFNCFNDKKVQEAIIESFAKFITPNVGPNSNSLKNSSPEKQIIEFLDQNIKEHNLPLKAQDIYNYTRKNLSSFILLGAYLSAGVSIKDIPIKLATSVIFNKEFLSITKDLVTHNIKDKLSCILAVFIPPMTINKLKSQYLEDYLTHNKYQKVKPRFLISYFVHKKDYKNITMAKEISLNGQTLNGYNFSKSKLKFNFENSIIKNCNFEGCNLSTGNEKIKLEGAKFDFNSFTSLQKATNDLKSFAGTFKVTYSNDKEKKILESLKISNIKIEAEKQSFSLSKILAPKKSSRNIK